MQKLVRGILAQRLQDQNEKLRKLTEIDKKREGKNIKLIMNRLKYRR